MHKFLIFHLLAYLGRNADGNKIIDGSDAVDSMPYMAAVLSRTKVVCGGFLIRDNFVLTAAHCYFGVTSVVLGTNNVHGSDRVEIMIDKKIQHKFYNAYNLKNGYDIMLLKLSEKVEPGNNKIKPIELSTTEMSSAAKCTVAGWGATKTGGGVVDDLKVVDVSIVNLEDCRRSWGHLTKDVICAGGANTRKGICQGDSGGPLVCNKKAAGVVSFNNNKECDYKENNKDLPNVYTDVSKYLDWIVETILANE